MRPFFALLILVLTGCSPNSLDDYQKEGQAFCHTLAQELKKIHSREELAKAEPNIKKKFNECVEWIMEARKYQDKHPDEVPFALEDQNFFSEELLKELKRIYSIEGGREIMERSQKQAVIRLDAFEKKLFKKKESLNIH